MTNDVKGIVNGLGIIHACCSTINDCGGCDKCPMGSDCFEYNSLLDSFESVSEEKWTAFVNFAEDVEEIMAELSMTAEEKRELDLLDEYDRRRKGERDEAEFGW